MVSGDLGDQAFCSELIQSTISKFQRIDILVNNAVAIMRGGIMETNVEELDNLINVNLKSVFLLTKLAAPYLIKSKGETQSSEARSCLSS